MQILELAVGQYTREGPVEAMRNICPLFSGLFILKNNDVIKQVFLICVYWMTPDFGFYRCWNWHGTLQHAS